MSEKPKKISACPSWLTLSADRQSFVFLPERAEVVRRIYELAIGGMGSYAIANYLDEKKVGTFGRSPSWDSTTIDNMLRSRATLGEYQPKSYAGGRSKGSPIGPPIPNYYPQVIDQATFDAAQLARRHNLTFRRGRKGKHLVNLFAGLGRCAYCSSEIKYHRDGGGKAMICSQDLTERGCTRTAWSYEDFEKAVVTFLIHPTLGMLANSERRSELERLHNLALQQSIDQSHAYSNRVAIAVILKGIITDLSVACAGKNAMPRLSDARVGRDLPGRYFDICLWDGPALRGISVG
ncbi:recombinase family protein [Bradyrhizobium sp. DOA1]|uniref:recombinase family protein n=1 Tax=Bradyrhizobium sp. DOA1 TaxID=1126616 RepID=UPI00077C2BFB|nr:recombinase family protein [Bradyrhizobium sp. DOA1]KYH01822.1 hypothetical protein SE91_28195 [Bradyrhizobium sp. DOA1]